MAMAALTGVTANEMQEAASAAMRDMKKEAGVNAFAIQYNWDPSDGIIA